VILVFVLFCFWFYILFLEFEKIAEKKVLEEKDEKEEIENLVVFDLSYHLRDGDLESLLFSYPELLNLDEFT
jgi:hypothetical protein